MTEYDIWRSPTITKFELSIASDAGSKGYFVYKLLVKCRVISGHFTPAEAKESSTFRELTAVHETWTDKVIFVDFEGQTVGHYTDNVAVVYILCSGSKQPKLQSLAMEVFMSLTKYRITLCPVWISRDS